MFRNATAATLAVTGLTVIFDVPLAWTTTSLVTTFATVYNLPTIVKKAKELKDSAMSFYYRNKPRAKALANQAGQKAADIAWACSPTNPEQNVTVGSALGFAAGNVAATLLELNARNYPLAVAAVTVASGTAGHFLPQSKVERGLKKVRDAVNPPSVGKVVKIQPTKPTTKEKATKTKDKASTTPTGAVPTQEATNEANVSTVKSVGKKI